MHCDEPKHVELSSVETRNRLENVGERTTPQNLTNNQSSGSLRLLTGTLRRAGDVQERHDDACVVDADPTSAASGIHRKGRKTPPEIVDLRCERSRPRTAFVAIAHHANALLVRHDRDGAHWDRSGSARRRRRVAEAVVERLMSLEFKEQRNDCLMMDRVVHDERQLARKRRPPGE
jgi:hypothetical protein